MMKRTFNKHKDMWLEVERYLIVCMLYHSESLSDVQKYLASCRNGDVDEEAAT
jgi:hypothetical protein